MDKVVRELKRELAGCQGEAYGEYLKITKCGHIYAFKLCGMNYRMPGASTWDGDVMPNQRRDFDGFEFVLNEGLLVLARGKFSYAICQCEAYCLTDDYIVASTSTHLNVYSLYFLDFVFSIEPDEHAQKLEHLHSNLFRTGNGNIYYLSS